MFVDGLELVDEEALLYDKGFEHHSRFGFAQDGHLKYLLVRAEEHRNVLQWKREYIFPYLEHLVVLGGKGVKFTKSILKCQNLKTLQIYEDIDDKSLDGLSGLLNLSILELHNINKIPESIVNFQKLENLSIGFGWRSYPEDLSHLSTLKTLKSLSLANIPRNTDLGALGSFSSLKSLSLQSEYPLVEPKMVEWVGLSALENLELLWDTKEIPRIISTLGNLKRIRLIPSRLKDTKEQEIYGKYLEKKDMAVIWNHLIGNGEGWHKDQIEPEDLV